MKTKKYSIEFPLVILLLVLFGCSSEIEELQNPTNSGSELPCQDIINILDKTILIDASHDGGVWWYPQTSADGFVPELEHQGKALANYLRNLGYDVYELPRGTEITSSLLSKYNRVIRAGKYGSYKTSELEAYHEFLEKGASLILISEYLRNGQKDELAEQIGLLFIGQAKGTIDLFADHAITKDIKPLYYNAGSVILNPCSNPDIEVLGWLSKDVTVEYSIGRLSSEAKPVKGIAIMGILHHPSSKIFFIGDMNGLELMPQPLVKNLVEWAFE